jgi:hypothetical protein
MDREFYLTLMRAAVRLIGWCIFRLPEYNDIIVLPIQENVNDGKTFAFLDWSFKHALVPPIFHNQTLVPTDELEGELEPRFLPGYDHGRRHGWARFNAFEARKPAEHDPTNVDGMPFVSKAGWVRPDYVVKARDDSFVMLAELEARLRTLPRAGVYWGRECPLSLLTPLITP